MNLLTQTTVMALTASVAHEVNQPLTAIVTNADAGLRWLSTEEPDLDEVRFLLKRIVSDGHRASQVITSVRSMFGKGPREKSPMSINEVLGDVLAVVNGELESHQILLQCEMHDGLPLAMADRVQIQQVLVNLIMNAIEAMSTVANPELVLIVKSEDFQSDHVLITLQNFEPGH